MNQFRPEYAEAVNAALWNHWFLLSLIVPLLLIFSLAIYRCHWSLVTCGFIVSLIGCWCLFGMGVYYLWDVKELHAQTDAEMKDVYSDTAKLFGSIFVGIPYAIIYTTIIQIVAATTRAVLTTRDSKRKRNAIAV